MSLLALGSKLARPSHPYPGSGDVGVRSPITVAGPRRVHTGFLVPPSPSLSWSHGPHDSRWEGLPKEATASGDALFTAYRRYLAELAIML